MSDTMNKNNYSIGTHDLMTAMLSNPAGIPVEHLYVDRYMLRDFALIVKGDDKLKTMLGTVGYTAVHSPSYYQDMLEAAAQFPMQFTRTVDAFSDTVVKRGRAFMFSYAAGGPDIYYDGCEVTDLRLSVLQRLDTLAGSFMNSLNSERHSDATSVTTDNTADEQMRARMQALKQMRNLDSITRCQLFHPVKPYSVAEHSFFTAMLAYVVVDEYNSIIHSAAASDRFITRAPITNGQIDITSYLNGHAAVEPMGVVMNALFHDLAEAYTGDIPYTTKHMNDDVKNQIFQVEQSVLSSVSCQVGDHALRRMCTNAIVAKEGDAGEIVSMVDMLELAWYCLNECQNYGNTYMVELLDNAVSFLEQMPVFNFMLRQKLPDGTSTTPALMYQAMLDSKLLPEDKPTGE